MKNSRQKRFSDRIMQRVTMKILVNLSNINEICILKFYMRRQNDDGTFDRHNDIPILLDSEIHHRNARENRLDTALSPIYYIPSFASYVHDIASFLRLPNLHGIFVFVRLSSNNSP